MREEKFKIIQFSRELIIALENHLDNFPRKDIELKNRIKNVSYDILENLYIVNTITNGEERLSVLYHIIAKLKLLDCLLNLCYDKQIINSKRYIKFGEKMDDILKYINGWIKIINQKRAQLNGLRLPIRVSTTTFGT